MLELTERLKELRGASSQAEMARQLDIKQPQWARYESGAYFPSVEMLEKICRIDACSADWLLGLSKSAAKSAAHSAARGTSHLTHGERPDCAGCPYKEQMKKFEKLFASTTKKKGKRK